MARLIDFRTSTNISLANEGFPLSTFPVGTPVLFGQVGLNVSPDETGVLRALIKGQAGIFIFPDSEFDPLFKLDVVRGTSPTDPLISTTYVQYLASIPGVQDVTVTAADYNVPPPEAGPLIYSIFATSVNEELGRPGPENFNASVYTD
ncbi:hypothetical protein M3223_19730 [Paenibacillus pasadenensis]|uniref:hypothetical protein n=1 Tax=Paenibacillus pasadenensis TaxID=217090 RepID=UPI00203FF09E|nr:hypothetical protein [Paenibacillus pasadenensis]MCM3749586.1 hypothetical protein [Paenibacillus pasadenensis]